MARATIQPGDPARPTRVPQPEPNLRADNSGRRVTSEGDLFAFKGRNQPAIPAQAGQMCTILPGFRMLAGSSARLIVRMTLTPSPSSLTRKSILP